MPHMLGTQQVLDLFSEKQIGHPDAMIKLLSAIA